MVSKLEKMAVSKNIIMCLSMDLFEFIHLEIFGFLGCIDSQLSSKLGKFWPLFFQNILSAPFSLSSPFGIPIKHMFIHLMFSTGLLGSVHFFFILFSFCSSDNNFKWPIFKFIDYLSFLRDIFHQFLFSFEWITLSVSLQCF